MTLIMTWIDTRKIVQVCDQRLTMPNGRLFDEQALKMICVASIDASFMLSYTGQAYLPVGSRTDRWLINSIQPVTRRPLPELAEALRSELQRAAAPQQGLAVIGAGYKMGTNWPVLFRISNYHDERGERQRFASSRFSLNWWLPREDRLHRAKILDISGEERAVRRSLRRRIKWTARKQLGMVGEFVCADKLAAFIRAASRSPRYGQYIGSDCVGAVLRPGNGFELLYYPVRRSRRVIAPHFVSQTGSYASISARSGGDVSESAELDFSEWPELNAKVQRFDDFLSVSNTGDLDWTEIRFNLNGRPEDYRDIARGFTFGPGYVYQCPFLAAGGTLSLGLRSFMKMDDGKPFNPTAERLNDLVIVAQFPGRGYGKHIVTAL